MKLSLSKLTKVSLAIGGLGALNATVLPLLWNGNSIDIVKPVEKIQYIATPKWEVPTLRNGKKDIKAQETVKNYDSWVRCGTWNPKCNKYKPEGL